MNNNKEILENFQTYDMFLSSLGTRDNQIALSLKMMYSIHMENNNKNILFGLKQIFRLFFKFIFVPLQKTNLISSCVPTKDIMIASSPIEKIISRKLSIPLVYVGSKVRLNNKTLKIYKEFFHVVKVLKKENTLKQNYINFLLHRLIDYLVVYHTVELKGISKICMENDREPKNLALVHKSREYGIRTIKYDNWLIDSINHNDIYCDTYFYPSIYHKNIIERFYYNNQLKYVEGGFLHWDVLAEYKAKKNDNKITVIYFTQFGIEISVHLEYIKDIFMTLGTTANKTYEVIVKVHPRERYEKYKKAFKEFDCIKIIKQCDDVYGLVTQADFCFSVFSTISLEAKHILNHSYFINYSPNTFSIIDYDYIGLDLVESKEMLEDIFTNLVSPVEKKVFICNNNCTYPNTVTKFQEVLNDK